MESENTNSHKLLFVDDDMFFLDLYSRKAKQYNLEMKTANGGEEALKKIDAGFIPDIFVVDLDMPNISGFELIEELKKRNILNKAYVVILTNKNDPYYIQKAKEYNVDRYIIKATRVPSEVMEELVALLKNGQKVVQ